ncbi:MAG: Fur family transcriptional regulator [Pseudomonadota bacterium]
MTNQSSAKVDRPAQVLAQLQKSDRPLSAYALLDLLRGDGFNAPLQIYRALEKLQKAGTVHRVESLNAFIACHREGCKHTSSAIFAICESCGLVQEFADANLAGRVKDCAEAGGFRVQQSTTEIKGLCNDCASSAQI